MTDGGNGSDKGKFTTNTSNSLFYLSSIKGWGLGGKCDSRKQDNFSKATFFVIAGFGYLKMSLCFESLILRIAISVSYHPPMKGCMAQKPAFTWRKLQNSAAHPISFRSTELLLYMCLTSLPRDAVCVSATKFDVQHSGRRIHCSKYF